MHLDKHLDNTSDPSMTPMIPRGRTRPHLTQKQKVKTELCRNIAEAGRCQYQDRCLFAHSERELRQRPTNPKFRKDKCKTFHNEGFCGYGTRCSFKHVIQDELITQLNKMVENFWRWKESTQTCREMNRTELNMEPCNRRFQYAPKKNTEFIALSRS
ncbi:protein TIS11-like [Varroa jacobsoni]|uniref:C3H1-type domain-containing protein n=1 Tax=Varroa destructor TaxID=109461 RepID=A0A7M7JSY5_VARDE|nr:protein TIS11-like [Varroa destructor]XP_022711016.1 protein TIS11-like [Varroa jacobsoni]XP_022711017.1 protein TIS11-like [Varroa jacobsoni]XP_022711018.1 protein TIS11-like [Varroa jacobsoni]